LSNGELPVKAFLHPLVPTVLGLLTGAAAMGGPPLPSLKPVPQAVLEVEQTLPPTIGPGAAVPVEIRVRNVGQLAADDLKLIDVLPAGYQLRDASVSPTCLPDRLVWPISALAPGENVRLTLVLQPTSAAGMGPLQNKVEVTFRTTTGSTATCAVLAPNLTLNVGPVEEAFPGRPTRLELIVRNQGTAPARNVTLQTLLPPDLWHPRGPDLEVNLDVLAPGESRKLPLEVTPQRPGEWPIPVSVKAQGMTAVVQDVRVVVQDIRLSAAFRGPESLEQQFTGLFEITIRNEGKSCARQVSLVVALPEGLSFLRATGQGSYARESRTLLWNLGDLHPQEARTVAWNSLALYPGDLEGKVRLLCGSRTCHESAWKTHVRQEETGPLKAQGED
jgi:hypothetical protein